VCAACRKLEHGNHPDLHRLAPEGGGQQIRIGQVQGLAGELALLPLEGRFRVAIIERAQRLNLDAQNALLKTLEEPPEQVVIVLAADDLAPLLPTVISRCVRVRLGPLVPEQIGALLDEQGLADPSRGATLGRVAGGRPGIAVALAGQPEAVIARGRLAGLLLDLLAEGRARRLRAVPELLDDGALLEATATGGSEQPSVSSERRSSPAERRAAAGQLLAVWRDVARDLAVAVRGGRRELHQPELLDALERAGGRVDARELTRFLAGVDAAGRALDAYANPELALDALLLAWPGGDAAD
jgi:DNA polymerase-3 subunit delta'